jgi:hypothetical protein
MFAFLSPDESFLEVSEGGNQNKEQHQNAKSKMQNRGVIKQLRTSFARVNKYGDAFTTGQLTNWKYGRLLTSVGHVQLYCFLRTYCSLRHRRGRFTRQR